MADHDQDEDKGKPDVPPPVVFKGPKLIEQGYADTVAAYGLDRLDLKIYLGDGKNGGASGKWWLDLIDTETGEVCGHYNYAHCPDPLNPDCD